MELWARIAETLETEIEQLENGAKLASEHELAVRFDATRATVRKALGVLESKYAIRRIQGRGSFVNRRIEYVLSSRLPPSVHETVRASGGEIRTVPISVTTVPAPDDIAARLDIAPGTPCTRSERIGYIDDELVVYSEEWLDASSITEPDVRLRLVSSITELLRDQGATPVRSSTRATTDFTPATMTARLGVRVAMPAWRLETETRDKTDGRILMFSRGWQRQDRLALVIEFEDITWLPSAATVH